MSKRVIKVDQLEARRRTYKNQLDEDERDEAVVEALMVLRKNGIDIGPKAEAFLEKREKIRQQIPKEDKV